MGLLRDSCARNDDRDTIDYPTLKQLHANGWLAPFVIALITSDVLFRANFDNFAEFYSRQENHFEL